MSDEGFLEILNTITILSYIFSKIIHCRNKSRPAIQNHSIGTGSC